VAPGPASSRHEHRERGFASLLRAASTSPSHTGSALPRLGAQAGFRARPVQPVADTLRASISHERGYTDTLIAPTVGGAVGHAPSRKRVQPAPPGVRAPVRQLRASRQLGGGQTNDGSDRARQRTAPMAEDDSLVAEPIARAPLCTC
jgi:hypothetical protein